MIDFGGWWYNWEWSSAGTDRPSRRFTTTALLCGAVGVGSLVTVWWIVDVSVPIWVGGAMLIAFLVEVGTAAMADEWKALPAAYGIAMFLAGGFALLALEIAHPDTRKAFASLAPCLTLAAGPITSRAIGATIFARRMVDHVREEQANIEKALAGDAVWLVVQIARYDDAEVTLTTVGENKQTLKATWSALERKAPTALDYRGDHLLLEAANIGDLEASGYRDEERARRLVGCKRSKFLGRDTRTLPASVYWDEVRAGILVLALEHVAIGVISVVLAVVPA